MSLAIEATLPVHDDLGAAQRTRNLLLRAGIRAFAERGYHEASTRLIESEAGVQRNLITHHWGSKETFWKACVDQLMDAMQRETDLAMDQAKNVAGLERLRFLIRAFIRAAAKYPEVHALMVDEGKRTDGRLKWIVQHHVRRFYAQVDALLQQARELGAAPDMDTHNFYYALVGASAIFTMAPECRLLSGKNPQADAVISRHADAIARLLIRDPVTSPERTKRTSK